MYVYPSENSDYLPTDITITISDDDLRRCTALSIVNDDAIGEDEVFFVTLNNMTPDIISVPEGGDMLTVTLLDDECKRCTSIHLFMNVHHTHDYT